MAQQSVFSTRSPRAARLVWLLVLALIAGLLTTVGAAPAQASLTASISGTVTIALGPTPLSGVTVSAYNSTGYYVGFATTNGSGNYTISGLGPGTYTVQFTPASGTNYVREWFSNAASQASAGYFSVADGAAVSGKNAVLEVGATISGNVKGFPSANLNNVSVSATDSSGNFGGSAYTDASGNYTIQGLAPGSYTLFFDVYPGSTTNYVDEWWIDKSSRETADYFAVAALESVTGKNAVLILGGTFSGNVKGFGSPDVNLNNAAVTLYKSGAVAGTASTDGSGNYTFWGVAPGTYTVGFSTSQNYRHEWYNDKSSLAAADTFTITNGSNAPRDAVLAVGSQITGNVKGPGSVNLQNVVVLACTAANVCDGSGVTDVSGNYTISGLFPVGYRLKFQLSGYGKEWYSDQLSFDAAAPVTAPASGINEVLGATCSITGTMYGGPGAPITAVISETLYTYPYVAVYDASTGSGGLGSQVYVGPVDSLANPGSYVVPGLGAGTYKMQWFMESTGLSIPSPDPANDYVPQWYNTQYSVATATPIVIAPPSCSSAPLAGTVYNPFFADAADPSSPFFAYIQWMAAAELSFGTAQPSGKPLYMPLSAVSRQSMALFLYRLSGDSFVPPNVPHFADVPTNSNLYPAIEWMYAQGISTGTAQPSGLPLYKPVDPVSRQSMALFLARYAGANLSTPPTTQRFADVPLNASTAAAIEWMWVNGISTGTAQPSGLPLYKPADPVSRQAMAAFLYRVSQLP